MTWDVIVIGSRCAGAPLAMLLARAGWRVLVLDKARFPSDAVSTHTIQLSGVCRLRDWGLLAEVLATGCPPIERISLDLGFARLTGSPRPLAGLTTTLCCRRIVLDQLLVNAAIAAGAQVRVSTAMTGVLMEAGRVTGVRARGPDGRQFTEQARIVVGADGYRSALARLAGARMIAHHPSKTFTCYAYWTGLPFTGVELFARAGVAMATLPTNDSAHIVVVQLPIGEFGDFRGDPARNFRKSVEQVPRLGDAVGNGEQAERFRLAPDQPGIQRQPWGPGWVLAGDAACHKDSVTAQGISDAFHDAHTLAAALTAGLSGQQAWQPALADWEAERAARILPVYARAAALADLAGPDADEAERLRKIAADQDATDDFLSVDAGSLTPEWSWP